MTDAVLAFDLGGSKILAGLVQDGRVLERRRAATPSAASPEPPLTAAMALADGWDGRFGRVAIAVSGRVADGCWSAVNPAVLAVPEGFPLVATLRARFDAPVTAMNDAQAAAWGEHRFGAGEGRDIAFVTVSTGIGAGFVTGGCLLIGRRGLAGHLGQMRCGVDPAAATLEAVASGRALGCEGRRFGVADAEQVFAAAQAAAPWATALLDRAAAALAGAFASLQALIDPDRIVLGGGVGLAPGLADRVRRELNGLPDALRPEVVTASLGAEAGLIGAADYAMLRQGS